MAIIAKVSLHRWNASNPDPAKEYVLNPTTPVYDLVSDPMTFTPDGGLSESRGQDEYTIVVEDGGVPIATSANTPNPPAPVTVPVSVLTEVKRVLKDLKDTGGGGNFLADDGTYKAAGGGSSSTDFIVRRAGTSGSTSITTDTVLTYPTSTIANTSIITVNGGNSEFTCVKSGRYEVMAITNGEIDYQIFSLEDSLETFISISTGGGFTRQDRSTGRGNGNRGANGSNRRDIEMVSYLLIDNAVPSSTKFRVNCNPLSSDGAVYNQYTSINIKYLGP